MIGNPSDITNMLRMLGKDEQILIEAAEELKRCEEKAERLVTRIDVLKRMIEMWKTR